MELENAIATKVVFALNRCFQNIVTQSRAKKNVNVNIGAFSRPCLAFTPHMIIVAILV
ncbi:hypothetical protein ACSV5P_22595 [Agrobacterium cavarae]|uniref:hypothetical protein n=1 Tax=Agrobacterium cavarae TaxID=2528239 RepID=UPI003FD3F287